MQNVVMHHATETMGKYATESIQEGGRIEESKAALTKLRKNLCEECIMIIRDDIAYLPGKRSEPPPGNYTRHEFNIPRLEMNNIPCFRVSFPNHDERPLYITKIEHPGSP